MVRFDGVGLPFSACLEDVEVGADVSWKFASVILYECLFSVPFCYVRVR